MAWSDHGTAGVTVDAQRSNVSAPRSEVPDEAIENLEGDRGKSDRNAEDWGALGHARSGFLEEQRCSSKGVQIPLASDPEW